MTTIFKMSTQLISFANLKNISKPNNDKIAQQ